MVSLRGASSGTYAGLLLLQDRGCTAPVGIEGNAGTNLRGVLYAPAAALRFSGRVGLVLNAAVIARTVRIDGGTAVTLNTLLP